MKTEKFQLTVNDFNGETEPVTFKVTHEYLKSRAEQADFDENVIHVIREQGKDSGFLPYNNFECSVEYSRVTS